MTKIHRNDVAPFRFLTPFPHHPHWRLRNSALKHIASCRMSVLHNFFIRLISPCSNILSGRFHRLPSVDNIVAEKRCWGDPREYVPLVAGRKSEKGRQRVRESKRALEGGRRSAFPYKEVRVRLNLKGRSFHSCVFYPPYLEEKQGRKMSFSLYSFQFL